MKYKIRQLTSNKSVLDAISCLNNETLILSQSDLLSKILKGYYMVVKIPKNLFFCFISK